MKFYISLFFLLPVLCLAQTLSGRIVDKNTNLPIDAATIFFKESKYTLFSNNKCEFLINLNAQNTTDELLISSIGYEDLVIKLLNYPENKENHAVFQLVPKREQLEEVIIKNEKTEYSWAKTISSKRKPEMGFSFQFGAENVRLIQNPYRKKGKIKKVILSLNKWKSDKKWKLDYHTAYSIKFYSFDKRTQKPGKEIYDKNIIVEPENKAYDFVIDVDSLSIPFSVDGVCVGVEYVNTKYENPKKVFAVIAPGLNFYEEKSFKPVLSWYRYRGESQEFQTRIFKEGKERYHDVLVMDLVVNTEK